ncbi:SDR family oxidoreductase [Saccharicrinis aurantiacus]|uniref:SDR family oxidoreductase n=1 Tax=Saccharicrinis aurantiacus TaxID=1849719 RepID=UPI000837EC85|nr:SDR family oxidoreductase [Saccharicrinis aurantiacus]
MSISIKNRVALVTGANRGIGKAIVETFIAEGAKKVYLAVRNVASTKELEEKYGDKVQTVQLDVSNTESVNKAAELAQDVEILVNNAGIGTPHGTLGETAEADFMNQLNINAFGLIRVANAFAGSLVKSKGAIVQMNSVASIKNFPPLSTYSASKAAAYSLTQGLRVECGAKGVHVLSVHPGPIETEMAKTAGFPEMSPTSVVSEGIVKALANGEFHLFPDEMAKMFEGAYQSFSENIVMADMQG